MKVVAILKTDVTNLKGTSDKKCHCDSWLSHWEKYSEMNSSKCSIVGCSYNAAVGAHVVKYNSLDKNHYIVPMCQGHNLSDDNFITVERQLISANVNETCGAE